MGDASNAFQNRGRGACVALAASPHGLVPILIVVGGFEAYEGLRHVMTPNWPQAFANAARVESLKRWGHLACEQSVQRLFLGMPHVVQAMNVFYFVGTSSSRACPSRGCTSARATASAACGTRS